MDLYELLEKRNPVDKEKESKSLVDQLIKRNEILSNKVKALEKELCRKENVIKNIKILAEDLLDSYAKDEGKAILEIIEDLKGSDKE